MLPCGVALLDRASRLSFAALALQAALQPADGSCRGADGGGGGDYLHPYGDSSVLSTGRFTPERPAAAAAPSRQGGDDDAWGGEGEGAGWSWAPSDPRRQALCTLDPVERLGLALGVARSARARLAAQAALRRVRRC